LPPGPGGPPFGVVHPRPTAPRMAAPGFNLPNGYAIPNHATQAPYYPGSMQMYGTLGEAHPGPEVKPVPSAFVRGQRRRMNAVPMALSVLLPWALFCGVFAVMSFHLHYTQPPLACLLVALGFLVVVGNGLYAVDAARKKATNDPQREPTWVVFMFIANLLAWLFGVVAGDLNFFQSLQPFYDVMNLNLYPDVDPALMRGQMLMDAGRIIFTPDSRLDLSRSMGFKNLDVYCVAPISKGNGSTTAEVLANYDFWAVGVNCCSGNTPDFHCGQWSNPQAHGGLRLMDDDARPYFRLAVQQAEAAYNIKAFHPLFFYWTQDPIAQVDAYQTEGFRFYLLGVFSHFALQLFLVASAVVVFSKLGHS